MSGNGVNLHDLRLKLFGPTLDDSVLYGVDRMIDCFRRCKDTPRVPVRSASFYRSCETLPPLEPNTPSPSTFEPPAAKLSPDEMDLIIDAIVQSRRQNGQRYARKVNAAPARRVKSSEPRLRETRWALARINEFDDGGKTYEIMKPLDGSRLPTGTSVSMDTEIVFALLQNGTTLTYRIQPGESLDRAR
ncbi:uncharacterized protein LOC133392802 [Anopheles gambiae]|uniref:uncharacterized protein LOC133392802 n=1 Tax=Anopheles gambiae TaxID=7165 RepID=UPI002AC91E60|nr:uncharacterized protein LOC133392802 [Anopheles gambiae]XP_061510377.1 uncharacterized protein LOC133392802 [Anopheles gambiae]